MSLGKRGDSLLVEFVWERAGMWVSVGNVVKVRVMERRLSVCDVNIQGDGELSMSGNANHE